MGTRMTMGSRGLAIVLGIAASLTAFCDALPSTQPSHWSFLPICRPGLPQQASTSEWVRSPIDAFVLDRLQREGLAPSPEATRTVWLRRVSLDLTGLPPSPQEVELFEKDASPNAYDRVVDRLLASPRYGERWAQHWLDVVRYADTHGFEVNTERPNAWPYRDYVIKAFNQHTPYDRFVLEQVAGDALRADPATGFLVTASVLLPGQIGADEPSKRLARQDSLDEIVVNISQTFLGLTAGCARCHDHKFDPISQRDYYQFQALVAGVEYEERDLHTPEIIEARRQIENHRRDLAGIENELVGLAPFARPDSTQPPHRPAVQARLNVERINPVKARKVRLTVRQTNNLEPCVDELEVFDTTGRNVALSASGASVSASGETVSADRHELRFLNDGRYGNSSSWMSSEKGKGWVVVEFPEDVTISRILWGRDRLGEFTDRLATNYVVEVAATGGDWKPVADSSDRSGAVSNVGNLGVAPDGLSQEEAAQVKALLDRKAELEEKIKSLVPGQRAFAGKFRAPDKIHFLVRGDPELPKDLVVPATLKLAGGQDLDVSLPDPERRMALARWIVSTNNPLTARVMANRIWQKHFGAGLSDTPSDFGLNGAKPSHPELLDWLASELMHSGWSIQRLHRLIVLSATYRQSATFDSSAAAKDAEARWLWRYPARRLEAEAIRDSMLWVSGRLDTSMHGPGFDLFDKRGGLTGFKPVEVFSGAGLRRMIYAHKVRREREAVFGAFDCPDGGLSADKRRESYTPLQALNLFNSRFTLDQALALSERVEKGEGDDLKSRLGRVWSLALNRDITPEELTDALPVAQKHGLVAVCRSLLNTSEFISIP
ncbi:MAG: DUF1553 domain-containing protein [Verrucomicrobia bacterium]|nr:DUF1553 domain-containing protein [Verrucomicrobiota bacterium]